MKQLNAQQHAAVHHTSGPLLILAGAGTGKTTVITEKIAHLIELGIAQPEQILALTFTDNAAAEMLERVEERLTLGYTEMSISTFHTFCQELLQTHGLAIGVSTQARLLTETDAWLLMRKHLYEFNLDYYRPRGNPGKHISALLNHFSECKDELISPEAYMAYAEECTGNKKMEEEERQRIMELAHAYNTYTKLLLDAGAFDFGDLIYYAVKLLEERPIIRKLMQKRYTHILVDEFQDVNWAQYYLVKLLSSTVIASESSVSLRAKRGNLVGEQLNEIATSPPKADPRNDGIMTEGSFADTPDDKQEDPYPELDSGSPVRSEKERDPSTSSRLSRDSAQEDSAMLSTVTQPHLTSPHRGGTVNLTVVGDDDQSIYAFRGASVSNILRFTDDFPDATTIVLTENYRSGQEILDVAYHSIQGNNPDRLEPKLNINKKLIAAGDITSATVKHLHLHTLDDEVLATVEEIERLKQSTNSDWDDIAILVRAGNHASPFMEALDKARIPYEFLSSRGLYREPIVLDAINFFRLLDNVKESSAVYRMLKLPCFDLPQNDIQKFTFAAKKKSVSYYEMLKLTREFYLSAEATAIADQIITLIHDGVKRSKTDRPTIVLYHFFKDSGYFDYIAREEGAGNARVIHDIHQLKQFFRYIEQFEQANPGADVREFMEHFDQVLESGDAGALYQPTDTPDSVNIMTVHASKGLEYRFVFVVNMVDERFPTRRRGGDIDVPLALIHEALPEGDSHYEEERRLFYVAVTRAKEQLYLMSSENAGGVRKKKISRFLDELKDILPIHTKPLTTTLTKEEYITLHPETKAAPVVQYELPTQFSFSQINSFRKCPYLYKLDHILKIPPAGSHYFSFGNTMHLTLQRFYEQVQQLNAPVQTDLFSNSSPYEGEPEGVIKTNTTGKKQIIAPPLAELISLYKAAWVPDWYESEQQRNDYKKAGEQMLRTYYKKHDGNWSVPIALEGGFKIKIGDYLLRGKIDRIDLTADGKLNIIDYKTGTPKEKVVGDDKDQLLLYQLVAQSLPEYRNYGDVSHLTFSYLDDASEVTFIGTDKELDKLQAKIVKTIEEIYATDWAHLTKCEGGCMYCGGSLI